MEKLGDQVERARRKRGDQDKESGNREERGKKNLQKKLGRLASAEAASPCSPAHLGKGRERLDGNAPPTLRRGAGCPCAGECVRVKVCVRVWPLTVP